MTVACRDKTKHISSTDTFRTKKNRTRGNNCGWMELTPINKEWNFYRHALNSFW